MIAAGPVGSGCLRVLRNQAPSVRRTSLVLVSASLIGASATGSLAYDRAYEQAARVERGAGHLDPGQRREAEALAAAWRCDSGAR
jgi:hypothetical protein